MTGFLYLATPYTKFKGGINAAFELACRCAGDLIAAGLPVYSPIAHTHPIAQHAGIDPLNLDLWLRADEPMMDAARGLIVLRAFGWEASAGIAHERKRFEAAKKPVLFLDPGPVPRVFLATAKAALDLPSRKRRAA